MKRMKWVCIVVVFCLACAKPTVEAQQSVQEVAQQPETTPEPRVIVEGVYTEEQAAIGKKVFTQVCQQCHAPRQFRALVQRWAGRTVYDLFESIRTTMPIDSPGRLSREEYRDIIAYLINLNGYPAGTDELLDDSEHLKQIQIVRN